MWISISALQADDKYSLFLGTVSQVLMFYPFRLILKLLNELAKIFILTITINVNFNENLQPEGLEDYSPEQRSGFYQFNKHQPEGLKEFRFRKMDSKIPFLDVQFQDFFGRKSKNAIQQSFNVNE